MKLNRKFAIVSTTIGSLLFGGVALANPTVQQQIASYSTYLPKDWQANINGYLDTYNTITKLSSLLQGGQFSKIFGADAKGMITKSGTFNAETTMDKGDGSNGKAISDALAKQYGLTETNAGELVDTLNGVTAAKDAAVEADNNLRVSQQNAIINAEHVKQLARNTEVNRAVVNQQNISNNLATQAHYKAKEQDANISAMVESSTPFFFGGSVK